MSSTAALSGQQRALIQALREQDTSLSAMYLGAISALENASNPERYAQCAHSARELMEKLPEFLDVPTKEHKVSLKSKVIEIEQVYAKAKKGDLALNGWTGNIDASLQKFLRQLGDFFEWFALHHPRRREEVQGLLSRLEGSGRTLPKPLATLNVEKWQQIKDFFQSVAHHRHEVTGDELMEWMDALELFLLDHLKPRTFEDFSEIDEILDEGDGNA